MITDAIVLIVLLCACAAISCRAARARRILVLGTSPLARNIAAEVAARRERGWTLAGVVDEAGARPQTAIIERVRPDRIVVALADRRGRLPMWALLDARLRGTLVEDGVRFYERLTGKIAIEALTPDGLISASGFRRHCLDLAIGHALGVLVSAAALLALAPLFAVIALAIKLDSRGPVFFVHERVGLHGGRLRLLKFRTMSPARQTSSEWVGDNDGRITRVGRWLRRYHLDELPQLVNILRREMNLVGPRPHPVRNVDLFMQKIPYYKLRALVRPGLTGWAQVRQGYANGLDEEIEKMRYDLYYIKHMSAWLDVRILFGTVRAVLLGGAPADPGVNRAARRSTSLITSVPTVAPR